MIVDDFGDRMKAYEGKEAMRLLDVTKPVMVRLDGRAFSTLTRHMDKPVDMSFRACMSEAARATANLILVGEFRKSVQFLRRFVLLFSTTN